MTTPRAAFRPGNAPRTEASSPAARRLALPLAALLLLGGCQTLSSLWPFEGTDTKDTANKQNPADVPPEQLYSQGIDALQHGREAIAVQQFEDLQQYYPYSPWATNAQLMEGYAEYRRNRYTEAVAQLDRFIQLHPAHKDVAYAYYLRGLCYYEQIADISRDQKGTVDAMNALQEVVNHFPDSAYARDARLKIDLCRDHLAGKEMEIGRYYEKQHLYAAAIGRFQRVVDDFQTTNHTPEALARLTEIYLKLGMVDQAKKTAAVLSYNYPGSPWYQTSWNDLVDVGAVHDAGTQGASAPGASASGAPTQEQPGLLGRAWNWVF